MVATQTSSSHAVFRKAAGGAARLRRSTRDPIEPHGLVATYHKTLHSVHGPGKPPQSHRSPTACTHSPLRSIILLDVASFCSQAKYCAPFTHHLQYTLTHILLYQSGHPVLPAPLTWGLISQAVPLGIPPRALCVCITIPHAPVQTQTELNPIGVLPLATV